MQTNTDQTYEAQGRESSKTLEASYKGASQIGWGVFWVARYIGKAIAETAKLLLTVVHVAFLIVGAIANFISGVLSKASGSIDGIETKIDAQATAWKQEREEAADAAERWLMAEKLAAIDSR